MKHWLIVGVVIVAVVGATHAQAPQKTPPKTPAKTTPKTAPAKPEPLPPPSADATMLPLEMRPFTGDYDEMLKRRLIRVGVAYNRTHYFIDRGVQRGLSYEGLKLLEDEINAPIKQPKD